MLSAFVSLTNYMDIDKSYPSKTVKKYLNNFNLRAPRVLHKKMSRNLQTQAGHIFTSPEYFCVS